MRDGFAVVAGVFRDNSGQVLGAVAKRIVADSPGETLAARLGVAESVSKRLAKNNTLLNSSNPLSVFQRLWSGRLLTSLAK